MERVKRNSDREKNIEVRWLVDNANLREEPLKILKEKISVFEKPEHAQVHAHAGDEPDALGTRIFRFANLPAEPEVHRCRGKQKRGEGRIPRAVKDIAGDDEQIFPRRPRTDAPVKRDHDHEEGNESERVKKHGAGSIELRCRDEQPIYVSHIEPDLLEVVSLSCKIDI